ncbi:hypothetical protein [Desulfosporosinus sp.]|uniref:hypothetical protein n=1 Tax=Desulfosporosinus sp. TaxID=157907 RepID=UPI0025C11CC0|nr:hypothetical protein [Desulfosporosinus sp.]MBC2726030.1 hypothetical protein [Desulfosporosinus sp.]
MNRIFDVLKKFVDEDDMYRIAQTTRHITADGDEAPVIDFVKNSRIKIIIYNQLTIIAFDYRTQKYILVQDKYMFAIQSIGLDFELDSAIIQGAVMIAISEDCLDLNSGITSLDIINNCLGLEDENGGENISFQFSQISQLFEPYCLIRVDEDRFQLQFEEDFNRFYGYIITNESNQIPSNAVTRLNSTLLLLSSRSIAASIINCMESRLIEYSFLQLYQCLEYLYIINNSISISLSHGISQETAIDIVTSYKLKTAEEENLYQVLKANTPEVAVQPLYDEISSTCDENADKHRVVAAYIYKIRCNIAHLRYNQDNILSTIEWKKLIDSLSEIIYSTYQKMDNNIKSICLNKETWEKFDWKLMSR